MPQALDFGIILENINFYKRVLKSQARIFP